MLSVYRDHGVVRKEGRIDNFNKTAEDRSIYQLVDVGWLAVNRMKAWQGSLGISPCRGIVSGHYICFRPEHEEEPRFLNYLLRSPVYTAQLRRLSRGVRPSQIEIDNDRLRVLPVHLPGLPAQRAISDFLDAEISRIDQVVDAKRNQVAVLTERRLATTGLSVVDAAVESRRQSTLAWAESVPCHWNEVKLGFVARLGSGHTPSRDHPEWWVDCRIPWVTTGEVALMRSDRIEQIAETREMISELGLANSSATVHPKGTVLLCRTASAGYSAIMGADMATSQDFATWTCGSLLRPRYLLLCLRAMRRDLLGRLAMGSTHQTIYMPDIESIRIPLPPVDEQDRIVERTWDRLGAIDRSTEAIEQHIELLGERKQALISAAVMGHVDLARTLAEVAS